MGIPVEKESSGVQKLTEEATSKKIYGYFLEAQTGGFHGTLDEWKEKFPQIVESAGEKVEPKAPGKSSATWEEIRASGYRGSLDKYKEQFPNVSIIRPISSEKPIVETLEQEAQRIFEGLKKDNPNSSLTLESVQLMLEKEGEGKRARKERSLAIFRVSESLGNCVEGISEQKLERMVQEELEIIREKKAEKKRKNWQAYKRLLE